MNALTLGLIAAVCWGIHDVTVRRISQTTPLMATLLFVLIVGATFQGAVVTITGGFEPISQRALFYCAAAAVAFLVASIGLYVAFQRGPVRIVAPVIGSFPIYSVALASFQGAQISIWQWGAVMLVVCGIVIVSVFSDSDDEDTPDLRLTIGIAALSAFGFFATFALGQEASRLSDDLLANLITRIICIALMLPIFALFSLPMWPGRAAIPTIIIMGLLDGVALICMFAAGAYPSAQYAAVAASVFGLITILLAWMFLGEKMRAAQWFGCLVAFGGIGYLAL